MTAKELADELYNKMYDAFATDEEDHWEGYVIRIAKRCAIFASEIMSTNSNETQEFWAEVKSELENIFEPINNEVNESSTDV